MPEVISITQFFDEFLEEFTDDPEGTPTSELFEEFANVGLDGDE